jgi:serine/threonine protein kinase
LNRKLGTPNYCAPEIGKYPYKGSIADIFSAGIILLFMVKKNKERFLFFFFQGI